MTASYSKVTFAALWLLAVFALGIANNPGSLLNWTLLAALGIVPPVLMARWLNGPPRSMSEIIDGGRR
jgi:hypothetical protein